LPKAGESCQSCLSSWHASLEAGDRRSERVEDCVLRNAHSAKGLEFPLSVVSGLEGLFPHQGSVMIRWAGRRTSTMGAARTMRSWYLSYASHGVYGAKETYARRSRFLDEMPAEYLVESSAACPGGQRRCITRAVIFFFFFFFSRR
jgi:DNA helicase-2/ATP-dependent DNA helicase PcrA